MGDVGFAVVRLGDPRCATHLRGAWHIADRREENLNIFSSLALTMDELLCYYTPECGASQSPDLLAFSVSASYAKIRARV